MEPVTFIHTEFAGLKIVMEHSISERNKWGETVSFTPAKVCQFVNGKFTAHTEQEVEFMRKYCMKYPNQVWERTKDDEEAELQYARYIARKSGRRPGMQGPVSALNAPEEPAAPQRPVRKSQGPASEPKDPLIDVGE